MMTQGIHVGEEVRRLRRCIDELTSLLALPPMPIDGDPSDIAGAIARQLDKRVAQRTRELTDTNEALKRELADRRGEMGDGDASSQLIADSIPGIVLFMTPAGDLEVVNRPVTAYFGKTLEELRHWRTNDAVHPEDRPNAVQVFEQALASGEPYKFEARFRRHDGAYRWFQCRGLPHRDSSGRVIRWYAVGIDIDRHKRAEDALRQSEARLAAVERDLRLTIDTIPVFVAIYRPDGTRMFVNRTWQDYMGLTLEEATGPGAKIFPHFHSDDAERNDKAWRAALASGEPLSIEIRVRRADGQYRWHTSRRVPLRDENGSIVRWYSVGIDIDDRKTAEDALRHSEARLADAKRELQATIDSVPALVASYWPDGERDFVNLAWQRFTGISQDQARGKTQMIPVHPDLQSLGERTWQRCLETGEPFELEEPLRRVDGEYRWHWVRRVPARDESGKVIKWYGVGHDIEDQKHAEAALRQREAQLAEAERELRVTLDSIPTITWRAAPNGYVQHLNKRWFDYTGTTHEQVRGWRWKLCVHPDDLDRLVDIGREYVATGTPIDGEARLRRFDGEYRWFLFRPAPARDEAGKIVGWYGTITDIEDRKQAEQKAVEAEHELQMAIDNIPVLVGTFAADGTRLFVNKRTFEVTGLCPEDVPGHGWRKAFHPDDVEPVERQWRDCLARGEPFEREIRTRMADGTYRLHQTRRVPVRDAAGKVIRWYGIGHDIEDQKRAEQAVAASERNLKLIIDTMPAVAWSACPDGSAEFFNQNYLDYVGLSLDQVQGWGWTVAVHPDDLARLACTWQEILTSGKTGQTEARLRRHDGEYRWFLFRASPLHDENGNIVKWYGVNTDIEDRRRAEEELRRSETFLAEGQRISSTGTFAWRVDTDALKFSEELCRIFELDQNAPVTFERVFARIHPQDMPQLSERMKQIQAGRGSAEQEVRLQMPDGRIKHLRSVGQMVHHQDGRSEYLGAIQDVTERRVAEEARDKVRSELAHLTRVMSLSALTASIAHEVNQPLAGIITNASTCLRMLGADPPNVDGARETARRMIRDGNRAADVIGRLRALFSKKTSALETLDLNEATREVLALVFSDLLRNRVVLRVELDEDHPLLVTGDRVQLQQVILNLVRNASDAMSDVNDRPRQLVVRLDGVEEGGARLSVEDAGVGLGPQGAERLFDAFYTTKSDGMGIGLSVSRSIIESHGGKLWAAPNDGPGATFSFSIPRQAPSAGDDGTLGAIMTRPTRGAHDLTRNT
jgi:PAS domain S-box-containing protein